MFNLVPAIQNFALRHGVYISKRQQQVSVTSLLKAIWPIQTEHELVRIGGTTQADGGYLVPSDLSGIGRVFSPGVSKKMDFEDFFLRRGVPCEMIDGSVDKIPSSHALARFEKIWLSGSSSDDAISLDDWVNQYSEPEEDLLLQMDIEGTEYEAILSASLETIERFRVIVVEMHDLKSALSRTGLALIMATLGRLKSSHEIVHAHPNNCCVGFKENGVMLPEVIELTFLRKDRISLNAGPAVLPHPLDRDNTPKRSVALAIPGDN